MAPELAAHVAAILNAGYLVRHYRRGARSRLHRAERAAAIAHMGRTVRAAFNTSDDFEPLLQAVVDGLVPLENPRF